MTKNVKVGVYTQKTEEGGNQYSFNFYTDLDAVGKIKFVNQVTELLLTDNYYTIIKDMVFDIVVVNIFTDIDITEINEAPNSVEKIEEFLENTNIVDIVKANVREGLMDELEDAVEKNIEYRTGIHSNSLTASLSSLIKTIENKIKGIDTDSISEIASKLSNISGELTVDKLVDAYVDSTLSPQKEKKDVGVSKIVPVATKISKRDGSE